MIALQININLNSSVVFNYSFEGKMLSVQNIFIYAKYKVVTSSIHLTNEK